LDRPIEDKYIYIARQVWVWEVGKGHDVYSCTTLEVHHFYVYFNDSSMTQEDSDWEEIRKLSYDQFLLWLVISILKWYLPNHLNYVAVLQRRVTPWRMSSWHRESAWCSTHLPSIGPTHQGSGWN